MTPQDPAPEVSDIFTAAYEPPEEGAERREYDIAPESLVDDGSEAAALREEDAKLGVVVPERPTRQSAPINNPAMMEDPARAMQEQAEAAFRETFEDVEVTVTPAERERFVRAALFDSEMMFDIEIPGLNVKLGVAIPTEAFTASTPLCIDAWSNLGELNVDSTTQWLLAFQQLHVWYQVRSIAGTPTEWSTTFLSGVPRLKELIEHASNPDNLREIREMSAPRWRLCVEAVRLAERKYKICLEAWHDRSFFTSAGTA